MTIARKVAIIGAGASGLTSIKCCLDEDLVPVCFEGENDIGGLWNYSDNVRPGRGSVYKSCVINTSKEMMAYSDFPVPSNFPPFMPHKFALKYFRLYADKFDLLRHVQFGTTVDSIHPTADHDATGRWELMIRRSEDSQAVSRPMVFDYVMICTGHQVHPHCPDFPGLSDFLGPTLHSQDYRRPDTFADKNVLVVGAGNSAVDIAVDLSRVTEQVYLSTRRGAWIVSRMGPLGIPADALANSRFVFCLPRTWLQKLVELMANYKFHHENYGLRANHRALEAHPTITDDLPHRIMVGAVQVRSDVTAFRPNGVIFQDGTYEDIDAVILATGYNYRYEFLDDSILNIEQNNVPLYKYVFPPHRRHPTLAVIGLVQAIGSVIPISEMQARWVTQVFKSHVTLPDQDTMLADIYLKETRMRSQYVESQRHTLQTFWIEYMDDIAELIGCRPHLGRLFLSDPWLAVRCFLGPCVPAQYRLLGSGQWAGAKTVIRKALANNATATRTRHVGHDNCKKNRMIETKNTLLANSLLKTVIAIITVIIFLVFLYTN